VEQEVKKLRKEAVKLERAKEVLKESESRLRYLLTTSPAVIFTCKPAGDYPATFISENVKAQLGYEPNEFVENPKFWADHIHPEDRQRVFAELPRVFEHGLHTHEYRFQQKDGTYRWMREELRLVRDGQGKPIEIVGYWTDITDRKQAEQQLEERQAALEARTNELEEVNTALTVLLKRRDEDGAELEQKVASNVKELVLPYAQKLKKSRLDAKQKAYLSILESNLNNIISPFAHTLSSKYVGLTPTEIEIAHLVKDGKTTKDMAELLNVSTSTIESHRKSIRMKIGIKNKKANLRSHLLSMRH